MALIKNFKNNHFYILLILLISFIFKLIYVFYFTDYKNYLFSDMGGYWARAQECYEGNIFALGQWTAWAPFFHFYLTEVFKTLARLKLFEYRLEIILTLNIVYSTISVFCLYFISKHFFKGEITSLLVTVLYAFSFPVFYFNTFVLSENVSTPITIISLLLILAFNNNKKIMFFTGLFFAFAVCMKPALGLFGLPFFLYIWFASKANANPFKSALMFSIGFFLVIYLVLQHISYISKGEVKSLAGNGGVNFFIQQCKAQWVSSNFNGFIIHLGPGTYLGHPELARMKFATDHPIHDQKYFYNLGVQCIRENPNIWFENFKALKSLFIGPLFPGVLSAKGFLFFYNLFNFIIMFMSSSLIFLYFLIRDKRIDIKNMLLVLSVPFFIIVANYFYAPEQRYFYPALFAIYILFFSIVENIQYYKKEAEIFLIVLFVFYLLIKILGL